MLRINRETDYAIRVILALAKRPPGEIIPSAVIRQEMFLPASLSLQIISRLAHLNLIKTFPGRNGGIQLAHPPGEINLFDVIQGMEGPLLLAECLDDDLHCPLKAGCPIQETWKGLQGLMVENLKGINFQKLSKTTSHPINEQVK